MATPISTDWEMLPKLTHRRVTNTQVVSLVHALRLSHLNLIERRVRERSLEHNSSDMNLIEEEKKITEASLSTPS